jgi:hypothetical protein
MTRVVGAPAPTGFTADATEDVTMTRHYSLRSRCVGWRAMLAGAGACVLLAAAVPTAGAQQLYTSPERAVETIAKAVRHGERWALLRVFGRAGEDIVFSGDPVADAAARARFVAAYDEAHRISVDNDKATLLVGKDDFPFPVPLVRQGKLWRFDVRAGREEILARRIGRNELSAIQACLAYVDAQNEYAAQDRGDGPGVYAQRIVSRSGTRNGLYWPAKTEADQSPLGELFAQATAQGYRAGARAPFHGYYYRILTRQGASASGGAYNYLARGKMIGGFALLAYPADYGNSGIKTFIVNQDGVVFEKDLGLRTDWLARRITAFNPDKSWTRADTAPPAQ